MPIRSIKGLRCPIREVQNTEGLIAAGRLESVKTFSAKNTVNAVQNMLQSM